MRPPRPTRRPCALAGRPACGWPRPAASGAEHSDFGVPLAHASKGVDLIGADRAADMVVNIVAPFFVAWGSLADPPALSAAAIAVYTGHPPLAENQITRAMRAEVFGP